MLFKLRRTPLLVLLSGGGQSADGKKHSRGPQGQTEPVPWDGASDLRVYLVDNLINDKVAMILEAINKASLVAEPVEGNDIKRAKQVSLFMRWLINSQMPDFDREIELLAQYLQEKGAAVMGQFWETSQEKVLTVIRLTDLQAQFQEIDMQQLLDSGDADNYLKSLFEEIYGVNRGRCIYASWLFSCSTRALYVAEFSHSSKLFGHRLAAKI